MGKIRARDDRFLIITGLSGSGKTVVSRFLEDLGYYCVDNLPAKLIPSFVDLWQRREVEIEKVALVVDIREVGFTAEFPEVLKAIRAKVSPRLIFLEASDEALIKRFSETRRPHPLSKGKSVREGVKLERKRLSEIKNLADEVIDTSETTISGLKDVFKNKLLRGVTQRMQVMIISFGYKHGLPLDSDLVLDTRFLPNPFYLEEMRKKTGRSRDVRAYVLGSTETQRFLRELTRFLDYLIPRFVQEGKSYLNIAIGCTGGRHRSVVLGEELKRHLQQGKHRVKLLHRDIYK